jgi:hypothetical protein
MNSSSAKANENKSIEKKRSKKEDAKIRMHMFRAAGVQGTVVYESIFFKGKPAFLLYSKSQNRFTVEYELQVNENTIYPLQKKMFPYRPYTVDETFLEYLNNANLDAASLFEEVYREFDRFLYLEAQWKKLSAIQTLETYNQQKLQTTSYLFYQGDNDSGKSQAAYVHNYLDYRPLFSISLPSADVYSYLGYHDEGCGTIIEDEAEDLGKRRYEEKMKLYRSGYKKGLTVPRIEFDSYGERVQKFWKAFSCKIFDGLWLPNDRGFRQRCIPINMVQGSPEKDEITEEDKLRFDGIKIKLLAWHMKTYFDYLPQIETSLRGRIKELWKPKLQITALVGKPIFDAMRELSLYAKKEKDEEVRESLPAFLTKAVLKFYLLKRPGALEISFIDIWEELREVLDASDSIENPNQMKSELGTITKAEVGKLLNAVLGGRRRRRGKSRSRTYTFDPQKLGNLATKYFISPGELLGIENGGEGEITCPS